LTDFDEIFFGVLGCVTGNKWLDFGIGAGHLADPGMLLMKFYHCGIRAKIVQILLITQEALYEFL